MRTVRSEITKRDLQVAKWIARGEERDTVAEILETNRPAINRHMTKMMRATETPNGTAAIAVLISIGLLDPEDITGLSPFLREEMAARIAPDVPASRMASMDGVAGWLRAQKVKTPWGEAENHFNGCIDTMAAEWEVKIPGQRRDPDAPRPPQQPKRDT